MQAVLDSLARRVPTDRRVALVVAHPDDEVIAAGASLRLLTGLLLVHVTDGAPRTLDDAARAGFDNPAAYAAARQAELAAALQVAGCAPERAGLGIPDQDASLHMPAIARRLRALFARHGTQAVITHAYEGGHPDHDAVALAVHIAAPGRVIEFPGYHAAPDGGFVTGRFLPALKPRHCEERSDAAIQDRKHGSGGPWIATPQGRLAMTAHETQQAVHIPLDPAERARKRAMLDRFATQARILAAFGTQEEAFRPACPDFAAPPHPGTLNYEYWGWDMTGPRWRALAAAAQTETEAPCAA